MDVHLALDEVARWCAERTASGDPEAIELDYHATVWITIGECAPPWEVRRQRGSSAGASAPVAQFRYDVERREWFLHHGTRDGWCREDEAMHDPALGPLLDLVASDDEGRYIGLGSHFRF